MSNPQALQKPIHQCIKDQDPICVNCRYYAHLIGVGLGIRCTHKTNKVDGELPALLPSRYHTCKYFELKPIPVIKGDC